MKYMYLCYCNYFCTFVFTLPCSKMNYDVITGEGEVRCVRSTVGQWTGDTGPPVSTDGSFMNSHFLFLLFSSL